MPFIQERDLIKYFFNCVPLRLQATNPEVASKVEEFIEKLKKLKEVETPFTLVNDVLLVCCGVSLLIFLQWDRV